MANLKLTGNAEDNARGTVCLDDIYKRFNIPQGSGIYKKSNPNFVKPRHILFKERIIVLNSKNEARGVDTFHAIKKIQLVNIKDATNDHNIRWNSLFKDHGYADSVKCLFKEEPSYEPVTIEQYKENVKNTFSSTIYIPSEMDMVQLKLSMVTSAYVIHVGKGVTYILPHYVDLDKSVYKSIVDYIIDLTMHGSPIYTDSNDENEELNLRPNCYLNFVISPVFPIKDSMYTYLIWPNVPKCQSRFVVK